MMNQGEWLEAVRRFLLLLLLLLFPFRKEKKIRGAAAFDETIRTVIRHRISGRDILLSAVSRIRQKGESTRSDLLFSSSSTSYSPSHQMHSTQNRLTDISSSNRVKPDLLLSFSNSLLKSLFYFLCQPKRKTFIFTVYCQMILFRNHQLPSRLLITLTSYSFRVVLNNIRQIKKRTSIQKETSGSYTGCLSHLSLPAGFIREIWKGATI